MKKLFRGAGIALVWAALLLNACKTRQVNITHKDSTAVKNVTAATQVTKTNIDTTKTTDTRNQVKNKTIARVDSDGTKTVLTPVPGTVTTIAADGNITGQFSSIQTTASQKKSLLSDFNSSSLDNHSELKGLSVSSDSSAHKIIDDSTHVTDASKIIIAKADDSYIWLILGIVVIACGALYFYMRSIAGPEDTVLDVFKKLL